MFELLRQTRDSPMRMTAGSIRTLKPKAFWSCRPTLVFWWGLLLVLNQAKRLVFLPEALTREPAFVDVLVKTLVKGIRKILSHGSRQAGGLFTAGHGVSRP